MDGQGERGHCSRTPSRRVGYSGGAAAIPHLDRAFLASRAGSFSAAALAAAQISSKGASEGEGNVTGDTRRGRSSLSRGRVDGKNLRSEEHTSELQSQSNLVCRLLLEKKNNKKHMLLISNSI